MKLATLLKSFVPFVVITSAVVANDPIVEWKEKAVHDDVVYFAFSTPARVERFDFATQSWLAPLDLTASPTALHVDDSGIYYANTREVRRMDLDGENDAPYYNSPHDVVGLEGDESFLFVHSPAPYEGWVTSLRKSDGQFVDSHGARNFTSGMVMDPVGRHLYAINTRSTAFDVHRVSYSETGAVDYGGSSEWDNHGSFNASQAALYLSPDYAVAVRNTGTVYSLPSLSIRGTLAGAVDDIAYYQESIIIALRADKLVSFTSGLLASGIKTLDQTANGIETHGESVFAFFMDAEQTGGIGVQIVPFSDISAAQPDAPIDPANAAFVPENVIPAGNDQFFIVDAQLQSVFRWDARTLDYVQSFRLLDSPVGTAYSQDNDRLYIGYQSGVVNQIKLDEDATTEVPFANRPDSLRGMQALDEQVFLVDNSGAWLTFSTYDAEGNQLSTREWSYYSQEYIWDTNTRTLYYFRDDTSPNDLIRSRIQEDGTIDDDQDSPYHSSQPFRHPIRLATDGAGLLLGSGVIYATSDLTVAGSLANEITDAISVENQWISIRSAGVSTQLQTWSTTNLFETGLTIPGSPYRIFELSDGRLLVLTLASDNLVFSIVDLSGAGSVSSSPILEDVVGNRRTLIGGNINLEAQATGDGELTYQWFHNASPIASETGATLSIQGAGESDAGIYSVKVSNAFGSVSSGAIEVTLEEPPAPPQITRQPESAIVTPGDYFGGFYFWASYSGTQTFQWYREGVAIEGATSSSYNPVTNGRVTESDYGDYWVVVTDEFGRTVTSDTATLSAPAKLQGYSLFAKVPMGGITITTLVKGGDIPMLLRAVGPSLDDESRPGLVDPVITIYDEQGQLVEFNVAWEDNVNSTDISDAANSFGLPALDAASRDAAIYRTLEDGAYSILIEGDDGGSGWVRFDFFSTQSQYDRNPIPYFAALGPVSPAEPMTLETQETNQGYNPRYIRGWGPATGRDGSAHDVAIVWTDSDGSEVSNDDWMETPNGVQMNSSLRIIGLRPFAAGSSDAAILTPSQTTSADQTIRLVAMDESHGTALLEVLNQSDYNSGYRLPPLVPVGLQPTQVEVGGHALLASRGPVDQTTYQWSLNGINVAMTNASTVLLRNISEADEGNYQVTARNSYGAFTTLPVGLYVTGETTPEEFQAHHSATGFTQGGISTVSVELHFPEDADALGWSVEIPSGWTYISGVDEPAVSPANGAQGVLEWGWIDLPAESPATFSFNIQSPSNGLVYQSMTGFGLMRTDGDLVTRLANPNPLILLPERRIHRSDMNENGRIELTELLRIIEIYNYRESSVRTGRYSLDESTQDGVRPGSDGQPHTWFHTADYDRNGKVGLSELLRVIELYNYRFGTSRTGQYRAVSGTVDGFAPGP